MSNPCEQLTTSGHPCPHRAAGQGIFRRLLCNLHLTTERRKEQKDINLLLAARGPAPIDFWLRSNTTPR